MNKKLLILTGSFKKIITKNNLDSKIKISKINDKILAKPKIIKEILSNYDFIFFGTIDVNFQRFKFFMALYSIIFNKKVFLIDEEGNKEDLNTLTFILKLFPLFIIEVIYSTFCVLFYFALYYFYRWKFKKN